MNQEEIIEKYNKLKQFRILLDKSIINHKKIKITEFLKNLRINDERVNNNLNINFPLYSAPIKEIYGSQLMNYYDEIYIDSQFIANPNNSTIINCQLTHELLHSLSNDELGRIYFFGHLVDENYLGIDEATTQLLTEEIEGYYLDEKNDSRFYFIKNIMRILKVVISEEHLIKQYLNIDNSFENEINALMNDNDWLNRFSIMIKKYYIFKGNKNHIDDLKILEQEIIERTLQVIDRQISYDSNVYKKIVSEFEKINSDFLEKYNILKNKSFNL